MVAKAVRSIEEERVMNFLFDHPSHGGNVSPTKVFLSLGLNLIWISNRPWLDKIRNNVGEDIAA